jgi:norsolorinic acid ketoreductase
LSSFSVASGNKLIVVKIDSFSETDSKNAIDLLISQHGLTKLDVVIANAGICKYSGLGLVTPIRELQDHFNVNTLGPLILLQATWSLLQASSQPKFVVLTSAVGSMGGMEDANLRLIAYGTSKAAVNYIVRKLHFEYETLITVLIHPGYVHSNNLHA